MRNFGKFLENRDNFLEKDGAMFENDNSILEKRAGFLEKDGAVLKKMRPVLENLPEILTNAPTPPHHINTGKHRETTIMPDYIPSGKPELQIWGANFVSVCSANQAVLGLTTSDMTTLNTLQTTFNTTVGSVKNAKNSLKSAVAAEANATKSFTGDIRSLVRKFQTNPAVLAPLKESLGINPRNKPKNRTPPITPTGLMVEGFSTGVNTVKWKRSGNKPNTIFRIQAQTGTSANFVEVGSTNALTFDHIGQTPGVKIAYRVVAFRAKQASVPSTEVVVYNGGASASATTGTAAPALTLQKAA